MPADLHLVRLGPPSRGDTIHRSTCHLARSPRALRWEWADDNPDVDWKPQAPWLHACKVCKPPSPLAHRDLMRALKDSTASSTSTKGGET